MPSKIKSLIFLLTVLSPCFLIAQNVKVWMTKGDESVKLKQQSSIAFSTNSATTNAIIIDDVTSYQSVEGFGFSLTQGSAEVMSSLDAAVLDDLLVELFSPTQGNGISMLRVSIGSSDLGSSLYSYNPIVNDVNMNNFNLSTSDQTYLIPILKKILEINPDIKILATPWTAPTWMKTNTSWIGGSLHSNYYQAYANYFIAYLEAMDEEGISIWGITPQNEPENSTNEPSMTMTASEQLDWINNFLGPTMDLSVFDPEILCFDHNCDNTAYPISIMQNSTYVDGAAFHLYAGDISAMSTVYNTTGGDVYFTEQITSSNGDFGFDLGWHMTNVVVGSLRNWSKSVLEWNLATDVSYGPRTNGGCDECMGAITVLNSTTIERNLSYYIIGQVSKFIKPGATRLGTNEVSGLDNVAFRNPDGSKVLVVYNNTENQKTFELESAGSSFSYNLSGKTVATFVWEETFATISVDMSGYTVDGAGVHLAGSFNNWSPNTTQAIHMGANIYAASLSLTPGEFYEYKFLNGNQWGKEETPDVLCANGTNRYLLMPDEDIDLKVVSFNGCSSEAVDVTFSVDMTGQTVNSNGVHLAGSMNNWNTGSVQLSSTSGSIYSVTKQFQPEENFDYKFLNGDAWGTEETPGVPCSVSTNRKLEVPASNVSLDVVDFGGCDFDYISYAGGSWSNVSGPTSADHVSVEADYLGTPFTCDDLYVASGASVTVSNTGSASLEVAGDLENNGSMIISSGANLINSGAISGEGTFEIHRNTTFDETTGKYSFVGSPIASGTVGDLGSLVYAYDETVLYGDNQGLSQWVEMTSGSLDVGKGYASAYTGDVVFTGTPNTGAINVPITKTADAMATTDEGFNLVSNPYPSAVSFTDFMTTNMYDPSHNPSGAITGTVYVWDDENSNNGRDASDYLTITSAGVVGGSAKNSKTWSGSFGSVQGFFVQVAPSKSTGSYSIDFNDAMRDGTNDNSHFFREEEALKTARVILRKVEEDYSKDMLLAFGDEATEGVDYRYDALLFGRPSLQLYTLINTDKYVINALPTATFESVTVGMELPESGAYELYISEATSSLQEVVILDKLTGEQIALSAGNSLSFSAEAGEVSDRFEVVSLAKEVLAISSVENWSVSVKNNQIFVNTENEMDNAQLQMSLYDITGQMLEQKSVSNTVASHSFDHTVSHNRIYIVRLTRNNRSEVLKFYVQ